MIQNGIPVSICPWTTVLLVFVLLFKIMTAMIIMKIKTKAAPPNVPPRIFPTSTVLPLEFPDIKESTGEAVLVGVKFIFMVATETGISSELFSVLIGGVNLLEKIVTEFVGDIATGIGNTLDEEELLGTSCFPCVDIDDGIDNSVGVPVSTKGAISIDDVGRGAGTNCKKSR